MLDCSEDLIASVLDCAFEVHRELGPGLLESVYEYAMAVELAEKHIAFERQVAIDVVYKGRSLGLGSRADIVVDGRLLVELKAVDALSPYHLAQTMTYLRLLKLKRGLLLNFNKRLMKEGIKRVAL
ncbi:MAG: GxxExxY protein [Propionivibrio sp.]|uniref:GxxExxY protein n=1 Tax=Candidatus Propionivibrio dominans TaxID=2954373 RepID=A0A9D7ICX4_9RHOO|nr:GxxExxY protein [Candidatus Propionivibrio dominans]MBL0167477.1 GxxExxY protein [Propionivibrio sp.]